MDKLKNPLRSGFLVAGERAGIEVSGRPRLGSLQLEQGWRRDSVPARPIAVPTSWEFHEDRDKGRNGQAAGGSALTMLIRYEPLVGVRASSAGGQLRDMTVIGNLGFAPRLFDLCLHFEPRVHGAGRDGCRTVRFHIVNNVVAFFHSDYDSLTLDGQYPSITSPTATRPFESAQTHSRWI